jgi:hypothetical protein
MSVGYGTRKMEPSELEAWLGRVLVPVEPGERFVTRLRGRLVELRGARPTQGWVAIAAAAGAVLAAAMWLGLAMRLALFGLAFVGFLVSRDRTKKARKRSAAK